jgi:hypothetical protein
LFCNDSKGASERCTLARHDVRRRSQSNEEDRYVTKSDNIETDGENAASDQGRECHAEG